MSELKLILYVSNVSYDCLVVKLTVSTDERALPGPQLEYVQASAAHTTKVELEK